MPLTFTKAHHLFGHGNAPISPRGALYCKKWEKNFSLEESADTLLCCKFSLSNNLSSNEASSPYEEG